MFLGLLAFNGQAQTNLGASCGCPPVSGRPTVNLTSKSTYAGAPNDYQLNDNVTILSCDTTYILDQKIYVSSGKTIVIQPGTVVKGAETPGGNPVNATALIIERGGTIVAQGTESCPIVFTTVLDDLSGTYPIANRGKWGGVVILGRAKNNLSLAANGPAGTGKLCVSDGVGYCEGFNFANGRNQYGAAPGQEINNDNSGILRYVSIRHAGAIIAAGNELNSLTLGSVGSGTKIDHVEVVSGDDDAFEMFGGTVNLKYCAAMFSADDYIDYDLGWSGKVQFFYGLKTSDTTSCPTADNGIEADADDNRSNNLPRSHPFIWNATFVGNNDVISNGDNTGVNGINAKEYTEGEIYNSIFTNFRNGFNMTKIPPTISGRSAEAYDNWIGGSLKVMCNTFISCLDSIQVNRSATGVLSSDRIKFNADGNNAPASVPGVNLNWNMNASTNAVVTPNDVIPTPVLATTCAAPNDGFFTPANYRGAFAPGNNWLASWSYSSLLGVSSGVGFNGCPTDINNDGVTNNADFLDLLGEFDQSCD